MQNLRERSGYVEQQTNTIEMKAAPKIVCYWGPAGSGKIRRAKADCAGEEYYIRRPNKYTDFWHGYDGQTHVIIDAVDTGYIPFRDLYDLLHQGCAPVSVKARLMTFQATHVWLLATTQPATWMPESGCRARGRTLRSITDRGVVEQCFLEPIPTYA